LISVPAAAVVQEELVWILTAIVLVSPGAMLPKLRVVGAMLST
jgi:hypothetical protein